ncbi:SRPBCC family protein [Larkinella sp. VNQ87]|uniref:SRPBCC family protein n=1 Tax=Larkinella sp. VNQ87 TaxID=3400921 RepID=UPI003C086EA3
MKISLYTTVEQDYQRVWAGFDLRLFNKLSPPFPPVKVVRFDGCLKGDTVHLRLNFLLFKQDWISLIIDQQETEEEIFFIDKGTQLPFFLAFWQHKHRIIRQGNQTRIGDEITFRTPTRLTDVLLYPLFYALFAYRKPIYKKTFRR